MNIVSSMPVMPVNSTRSVSVIVRLSVRKRCPGESCSQVKPSPSACMEAPPKPVQAPNQHTQHVLGQALELLHRITHGGNAKGDAPAARRLESPDVLRALPRRAVSEPRFNPRFAVIGRIIEVEEFLGVGERSLLVGVHVDVVVEDIVETRHVAAVLARGPENEIPGALESIRADGMRHPAI